MSTKPGRLILPPCEASDDAELFEWFEAIRLLQIKESDELSEASAYVYSTLKRYAASRGHTLQAAFLAKRVAGPVSRAADAADSAAAAARLAARRFEGFIETVTQQRKSSDFTIKGGNR